MTNNELLIEISNIMKAQLQPVHERLDRIDTGVAKLEKRMDQLESRMTQMEKRMDQLENRMNQMEARMDQIDNRMDQIEARMDQSEKHIAQMKQHMEQFEGQMAQFKNQIILFDNRIVQVEILIEDQVLPMQRELSSYGASVYKRYEEAADQAAVMEKNLQVLMHVVAEHSGKLEKLC